MITKIAWADMVETDSRGGYRTYAPTERHWAIVVRLPKWATRLFHWCPVEPTLRPKRLHIERVAERIYHDTLVTDAYPRDVLR